MTETVWAIYENGVLRLLEPVELAEGQRVRVRVLREEPEARADAVKEEQSAYVAAVAQQVEQDDPEAVTRILSKAGLLVPRPSGPIPPNPLSEEERRAIARRAGRALGKTASEMVIEDRGEW